MGVKQHIADTIEREGGDKYTNDPKDSGGPTRWGITESVARVWGYTGDMRDLPRETAEAIYLNAFWIGPGFDRISLRHADLAEVMFDTGVLTGFGVPIKHLQRSLNVLNHNGKDYPDMVVDGRIGPATVEALRVFLERRGDDGRRVILGMVRALNSAYLTELAERRPKDETYIYGWQLNRALGK